MTRPLNTRRLLDEIDRLHDEFEIRTGERMRLIVSEPSPPVSSGDEWDEPTRVFLRPDLIGVE